MIHRVQTFIHGFGTELVETDWNRSSLSNGLVQVGGISTEIQYQNPPFKHPAGRSTQPPYSYSISDYSVYGVKYYLCCHRMHRVVYDDFKRFADNTP